MVSQMATARGGASFGMVSKEMFFDRQAVMSATDRGKRRFLNRAGATVRLVARRSIRKRKGISQPGSPPSSHAGGLKRGIMYGYDSARQTVVAGPVLYPSKKSGGTPVPELLERGGTVTRVDPKTRKVKTLNYQARPTMGPALEKVQPKLPGMLRDSIH